MSDCAEFYILETEDWEPMKCPACQGFLPMYFPYDKQFKCEKCGKTLMTLPSLAPDPDFPDEVDEDYEFGGRLCVVPDYAVESMIVRREQ